MSGALSSFLYKKVFLLADDVMGLVVSTVDDFARSLQIKQEQARLVACLPDCVRELNEITAEMKDKDHHRLEFKIVDSPVKRGGFFSSNTQPPIVKCNKVHVPTDNVAQCRSLQLSEFHHLYLLIQIQRHILQRPDDILTTVDSIRSGIHSIRSSDDSTCPICLERKVETVLTCIHSFCRHCLEQWREQNPTCPFCRQPIMERDEWVFSDIPKQLNEEDAGDELSAAASLLGTAQPATSTRL